MWLQTWMNALPDTELIVQLNFENLLKATLSMIWKTFVLQHCVLGLRKSFHLTPTCMGIEIYKSWFFRLCTNSFYSFFKCRPATLLTIQSCKYTDYPKGVRYSKPLVAYDCLQFTCDLWLYFRQIWRSSQVTRKLMWIKLFISPPTKSCS